MNTEPSWHSVKVAFVFANYRTVAQLAITVPRPDGVFGFTNGSWQLVRIPVSLIRVLTGRFKILFTAKTSAGLKCWQTDVVSWKLTGCHNAALLHHGAESDLTPSLERL